MKKKSARASRNRAYHERKSSLPANCASQCSVLLWLLQLALSLFFFISWNTYHDRAAECLEQTLKALDTPYLDLYLVHWPVRLVANETSQLFPLNPDGSRATDRNWDQAETWRQMEALLESGTLRRCVRHDWS